MEKTNELNKFLSYIHMGMSVYRIYHGVAKKLNDDKLSALIVEIEDVVIEEGKDYNSIVEELKSDTLVISPSYPSLENKYLSGFVHSRLKAYKENKLGLKKSNYIAKACDESNYAIFTL